MEKTVKLVFTKPTKNKLVFTSDETGPMYFPKAWFDGEPKEITVIVKQE